LRASEGAKRAHRVIADIAVIAEIGSAFFEMADDHCDFTAAHLQHSLQLAKIICL
jgi:hypothetical protein